MKKIMTTNELKQKEDQYECKYGWVEEEIDIRLQLPHKKIEQ